MYQFLSKGWLCTFITNHVRPKEGLLLPSHLPHLFHLHMTARLKTLFNGFSQQWKHRCSVTEIDWLETSNREQFFSVRMNSLSVLQKCRFLSEADILFPFRFLWHQAADLQSESGSVPELLVIFLILSNIRSYFLISLTKLSRVEKTPFLYSVRFLKFCESRFSGRKQKVLIQHKSQLEFSRTSTSGGSLLLSFSSARMFSAPIDRTNWLNALIQSLHTFTHHNQMFPLDYHRINYIHNDPFVNCNYSWIGIYIRIQCIGIPCRVCLH